MTAPETLVHPFERAGLGRAPFTFVGVERRVGPIRFPDGTEVGAPGQPMGTCDFCGQGIAECCMIRDADGKRFIVGNMCVAKTADAKLVSDTTRAVRAAAKERKDAPVMARIMAMRERVKSDDAVRAILSARPHPRGFSNMTALDWAEWMMSNAGITGRLEVCRAVDKLASV